MAVKKVLVIIEGEGGGKPGKINSTRDGEFRDSWKKFLQPLADIARTHGISNFQCVVAYGGDPAYQRFCNPLPQHDGWLRILIVDLEGPLTEANASPWDALKKSAPNWATDGHCFLMVQCLETWLCADIPGLQKYYDKAKKCFEPKVLNFGTPLEKVERKALQTALEKATSGCGRKYSHAEGNIILSQLDRDKIMALPSGQRLFTALAETIREYAKA